MWHTCNAIPAHITFPWKPTFWYRQRYMPHGWLPQPGDFLHIITAMHFTVLNTTSHPLSFRATNNNYTKSSGFAHIHTTHTHTHTHTHTRMHTHKRDILKQVPSFLHKDHWMHQATCPHSTNQLLRYSTKEHPATLYGISASSFKYWSSCNILPFCNYTSSPALLQYPQYSLIIFSTA